MFTPWGAASSLQEAAHCFSWWSLVMEALHRSTPHASASQRCSSGSLPRYHPAAMTRRQRQHQPVVRTTLVPCRTSAIETAEADDSDDADVQTRWNQMWDMDQYMGDNSFSINNPYNKDPDVLNDPEWQTKVTDWHEFWNNQKWDMEIEGVDDEVDVGGNEMTSKQRIMKLIESIKDNRLRSDVMQWMPPQSDVYQHLGTWEVPPVFPERTPWNPDYTSNDLRAIAEKKAWKAMMDAEWRRRQTMVGRLTYPDPYKDIRLEHFGKQFSEMDWGEKRVYNLITLGGTAARPEDHGGFVENPLVPIDYVQTMGVHHVEETEDFLERIGHLALPEDEDRFDQEVVLDALDHMGLSLGDLLEEVEGEMDEDGEEEEGEEDEGVEQVEDGDGF